MTLTPFCLVFPGQGSQALGMGQSYLTHPVYTEVIQAAEAILQQPLSQLMAEGPIESLTRTEIAQPALLTVGYGIYQVLQSQSEQPPAAVAGHSLGEYTALACAGALDFESALKLVQLRGQLMQKACEQSPGAMGAVLKADFAGLTALLAEPQWQGKVGVGNYNSPSQWVLSGQAEALEAMGTEIRTRKLGRLIPLKVSGAFHSSLMAEAQAELNAAIDALPLQDARFPVVTNLDGEATEAAEDFRRKLRDHLLSPVRWEACTRTLGHFAPRFFEMGPGQVLSGLIRQTLPSAEVLSLADASALSISLNGVSDHA